VKNKTNNPEGCPKTKLPSIPCFSSSSENEASEI